MPAPDNALKVPKGLAVACSVLGMRSPIVVVGDPAPGGPDPVVARAARPNVAPPAALRSSRDVELMALTVTIPRFFEAVWLDGQHEFTDRVWFARIEVADDGSAGLVGAAFRQPLSPKDLRSIPWQQVIDEAYKDMIADAVTGRQRAYLDGDEARHVDEAATKLANRAHQSKRRRVTPELLADVADVYVANGGGPAGSEAVADTFTVGKRQADRYVALARDEGLLS